MNLLVGGIVLVHDDNRVFAKVVDLQGCTATIEFFHSVAERVTESIDANFLTRLELQKETRVFFEASPGYWRVGRVLSDLDEGDAAIRYEVRFPNVKTVDLPETELYVRCLDVYADPAHSLAAGCAETQGFADPRRKALKTIRELRSACEGLTGPYSAAIELIPHQISTVRRVLQDSLVRYLLADEVGLGKTIEAGSIIRQMLLDRKNLRVLVLVPENLVSQWREELQRRFYIDPESSSVRVFSYERCNFLSEKPDLLVIDEAHRVIATGANEDDGIATDIEKLAHSVESLLLLSATPALGDEPRLFGLLHLLDPSAYPKSDLDGFRRKVQSRQEIGRLLMTMQPGGSAFVLKSQAKSAQAMFPDDRYVQSIAKTVIDSGDDSSKRDQDILLLRDHIARSYRIHDRLLRSRRVDAEVWAMRPRGEPYPDLSHVRLAFDTTSWAADLFGALESWRLAATATSVEDRELLVDRWRVLVTTSFYSRYALARRLNQMEPLFADERDYLAAFKEVVESDFDRETRLAAVCEELKIWQSEQRTGINHRIPKIICFVSDHEDATETYAALRKYFGPFDVSNISDASDELERTQKIAAFKEDPQSWVLIGSQDAEEGLNLQFVDAILHMDLPTDVARIEQRIGRLDRFGRRLPKLEHRLFLPNDDEDAPWYAWMDILMNGFQIFNGSVSDIQFNLQNLERMIWDKMFELGPSCAEELSVAVSEMIAEERVKLNEQHAIDAIANLSEDATSLVDRMEEAEEDEDGLNSAVSSWMSYTLHLNQSPPKPRRNQTHRVFWDKPLLPRIPWQRVFEPSMDQPITWRRNLAQTANANPILLRPGAIFVNALERTANWDDRGSAYATWRVDPSVAETWVGFRWVWILSPGLSSEMAVWQEVARPDLFRRSENYLPILTLDQWTDFHGEILADSELINRLNRPYCNKKNGQDGYDVNLGSRPDALAEIVDPIVFRDTLSDARERAMNHAWESAAVVSTVKRAKARLTRDDALIRRSLERREAYLREEFGQTFDGVESALQDLATIRQAIEKPQLRLDECGLMVISQEAPNARGK